MEIIDSIQIRQPSDISLLETMERKYRSIPMEAIIKQDVLRQGINFSKDESSIKQILKKLVIKQAFLMPFIHLQEFSKSVKWRN